MSDIVSSSPPSSASTPPPPPRTPAWQLLAVLVVGILFGLVVTRYEAVLTMMQRPNPPVAPSTPTTPVAPPVPEAPTSPTTSSLPEVSSSTITEIPSEARKDERYLAMNVQWQKPEEIDPQSVYDKLESVLQDPTNRHYRSDVSESEQQSDRETDFRPRLWKMGIVQGGELDKATVYLRRTVEAGMGYQIVHRHMIVTSDGKEARIAANYLDGSWDTKHLLLAPHLTLKVQKPLPNTLTLENGKKVYLTIDPNLYHDLGGCTNEICERERMFALTKEGFNLFVGTRYGVFVSNGTMSETCLKAIQEDGKVGIYTSTIPTNITLPNTEESAVTTPNILWEPAFSNRDSYIPYVTGGCGAHDCTDIVTEAEVGPMAQLVQAGKSIDNEPIYVPRNPKQNEQVQRTYEMWFDYDQDGEKPSIEVFLQRHKVAVFFWKDAFGRWVRYVNTVARPLAECGKPVIYLYPEKDMNVQVRLPSFVNVTVSEPAYPRQGWNVKATPKGHLTMPDGSQYGSLFWEGTGVTLPTPSTGFVVKDGEVDTFLARTLLKYGLNEVESREFREFWVPRMKGAPYYRVSFLTDSWDKAAPLSVTPRPQTSIRLFMDWRKLGAPLSLVEPTIVTPKREGFTLVEWGGSLWQ